MAEKHFNTLVNPQTGNLAFKIFYFNDNSHFDHLQRLNYYSIILLTEGTGRLKADFAEYNFGRGTMMCFNPYQPFMVEIDTPLKGVAVNFHPDFFCIHKHHKEVACHGVLFNNIYEPPFVHVDDKEQRALLDIIEQMRAEMQQPSWRSTSCWYRT